MIFTSLLCQYVSIGEVIMPKEITHWQVARETAKAMAGSIGGESALLFPHSRCLGAIYPDILYYLPENEASPSLAHYYHGLDGADTYYLIRQAASLIDDVNRPGPAWGFLLGLASHIATDTVFHPLVYYLTGNYEARVKEERIRAVISHRKLECLIDLFFVGRRNLREITLKGILSNLELPFSTLLQVDLRAHKELPRAVRTFAFLQDCFSRPAFLRVLAFVHPVFPSSLRQISSLFYHFSLDAYLPLVSGTTSYRHPVTGEAEEISLPGLFNRAVEKGKELTESVERSLRSGLPVLPEKGPSLSFGVEGEPRFFSPIPFSL